MAHAGHLIVVPTEDWATAAADHVQARLAEAVAARGLAHLTLAGGGTPRALYTELAGRDLQWDRVHAWFGDERCVPAGDADSNYTMARETLLDAVPAVVHRMRGEHPDRQAAAGSYASQLPDRLDVVLLGMGGDGHTASIFPGQDPKGRVAVVNGPKPPPWRLTLTAEALGEARELVVLVTGAGKAAMVRRVLRGAVDRVQLPVQIARDGTWILDTAAAAQLDLE